MKKTLFLNKEILQDVFNHQDLEQELVNIYSYFEKSFQNLYDCYAELYSINNYRFYIKNNIKCNAYATQNNGCNIITITNGYPILMNGKFKENNFGNIILMGLLNDGSLSDAYCELAEDTDFDFSKFILDCSIQFTFSHEFQHILQINHCCSIGESYLFHENLEKNEFDMQKHVWEFDADRMASYEVLKFVFSNYAKLKEKNNEKLKCLIFAGCASMLITKCLFYFGIMNQIGSEYFVFKEKFYLKKYSHPHPLVRVFNIIEYYYESIKDDFPKLEIDSQMLLNNCIGIMKVYFDTILPNHNTIDLFIKDLELYLDDINQYNQELYDCAVQDEAIKRILILKKIAFE